MISRFFSMFKRTPKRGLLCTVGHRAYRVVRDDNDQVWITDVQGKAHKVNGLAGATNIARRWDKEAAGQ